jgi:hypothetical protein
MSHPTFSIAELFTQSVRRNNDDFKELSEQLEWIIQFLGEQLKAGVDDGIEEYCMHFHALVSLPTYLSLFLNSCTGRSMGYSLKLRPVTTKIRCT